MGLPLALSVHRFVSSVGSYAGFAAIIGLAILILLFFAQARETSALRDHVDELLDRISGLESRLQRQAQAQAESQAAQAVAVQQAQARQAMPALAAVGGSRVATLPPFPPAGVGAPALSAATRVIPLAVPAAAPATVSAGVGTAAPPPTGVPANGRAGLAPVGVPGGPRPAPGSGSRPTARPATPAAGRTAPPANRRGARPSAPPPRVRPSRVSRGLIALVLAGVLAAAVIAVAIVMSSSSKGHSSTAASSTSRAASSRRPTLVVNPRTITVAVLNGTATQGLAHRTAQRLASIGFQEGKITTATDQTRTTTTVAYIPGARTQALAVAKALKLTTSSVAPVDQGTRQVGCEGLSTCTSSVFVTVGADLANQ